MTIVVPGGPFTLHKLIVVIDATRAAWLPPLALGVGALLRGHVNTSTMRFHSHRPGAPFAGIGSGRGFASSRIQAQRPGV